MPAPASPDQPATPRRFALPWPLWIAALIFVALLIIYPPVRIVSKNARSIQVAAGSAGTNFDAKAFAEKFWSEQLQPAASQAPEATLVLPAF
jgi:hypothetical protein